MDRPQGARVVQFGRWVTLVLILAHPARVSASHQHYILDSGEVTITGETNVFPFSGTSRRFEGCVGPHVGDLYQAEIRVAMDSFVFNVPFASEVIGSETQFDTARFPYVNLSLNELHPIPGSQRLEGILALKGEPRPIEIAVDVEETETGIAVEGSMALRQSDFGVTPFDWGILRVADAVKVSFQASFTEVNGPTLLTAASTDRGVSCFQ